MVDAAGLAGLVLLWLLGGGSPPARRTAPAPRRQPPARPSLPEGAQTSTTAPPWPQVVPSGLPPFPGDGWQYDEPPPAAVVQRAGQLVQQLWATGAGSFKVEQTAGRWIAYRAEIVKSGKKGVVAYRLKPSAPAPAPPKGSTASKPKARNPEPVAKRAPAPAPAPAPAAPAPAAPPILSSTLPLPAGTRVLPTLRRGDGIKPQQPNPDVKLMQQKLGIKADGQFGSGTESALKAWQKSHGLVADGVCGPKTWTALLAGF